MSSDTPRITSTEIDAVLTELNSYRGDAVSAAAPKELLSRAARAIGSLAFDAIDLRRDLRSARAAGALEGLKLALKMCSPRFEAGFSMVSERELRAEIERREKESAAPSGAGQNAWDAGVHSPEAAGTATNGLPASPAPAVPEGWIDIVFDGPPGLESGRFVEVENADGQSISFGEWVHRPDGYWALRIAEATKP